MKGREGEWMERRKEGTNEIRKGWGRKNGKEEERMDERKEGGRRGKEEWKEEGS